MAYLESENPTRLWSITEREILVARLLVIRFEGFVEDDEWEMKFYPVIIKEKVLIRAPFPYSDPEPCALIIEPKMSFGSGTGVLGVDSDPCSLDHLQTDEVSNWISLSLKIS